MKMRKYKIGDTFEGEVIDMGMNGEGIVKDGAYPIFVPMALIGERVKIQINYAKKDYAFADIIEVLTPSKHRIKPRCWYYGRCGGCDMQHMAKPLQLESKRLTLERTLKKNAGIEINVPHVISLNEWEYRNKLSLPFGTMGVHGRVVLGFYEKKSHRVVPIKNCPLHERWADSLIDVVLSWANENNIPVYDEKSKKGLLRHLVARNLDSLSAVLVINGDNVPKLDNLIKKLDFAFHDHALYVSVNKSDTNVIMGDTVKLVHGKERKQNLGAFSAFISPLSFLQVNAKVRDAMYDAVCSQLEGFDGEIVELYSGVGLLTAQLAMRLPSSKITAVEIVAEAVRDADNLMKTLELSGRVTNVCADAVKHMAEISATTEQRALILDPPRRGCDEEVLRAAIDAKFEKVAYISCNPATLSRDLKILLSAGYSLTMIQPYDMFPQTTNLETLAVLQK